MAVGVPAPRPFTVIGGFLGAGKTTLVNRILAGASGTRFAVLVNDFGAINVDAGLIAAHDGRTMALTNGCICCSLSDGFVQTMLRLMSEPEAFDHVVIEASGVAEPGRIMDFARADAWLSPDSVLVLADAETLPARLDDARIGAVVARQLADADLLLLNKTDLAGPEARRAAENRLRALNPAAPILHCSNADLPLEVLLGASVSARAAGGAGGPQPSPAADFAGALGLTQLVPVSHGKTHDHAAGHSAHGQSAQGDGPHGKGTECPRQGHDEHASRHGAGARTEPPFHSALVRREAPIPRAAFEAWEAALPPDLLRGKGRVALAGEGTFVWQRVGTRASLTVASLGDHGTEIVLIAASPLQVPPPGA